MNTIAFGASTSKNSINQKFARYVAAQFSSDHLEVLDLNDYPLPIYSVDLEKESGIPVNAKHFLEKIKSAQLLIISLAEHNGSYTSAFKNLFDWVSRLELKMFLNSKLLLVSCAPGPRGGLGVMETALSRFPKHGADILEHFCLPKFSENFNESLGIVNPDLKKQFEEMICRAKERLITA